MAGALSVLAAPASSAQGAPENAGVARTPTPASTTLDTVDVTAIRVEGSSVFTPSELAAATAGYERRPVSFEELQTLRQALSRDYLARGYVNSGVVIPDQQIVDGVVTLRAIEGTLTGITVRGNRRMHDRAIVRRIERKLATPLNIGELRANLRALQEDPLIERLDAQLLPGERLGQSYLRLGVTERRPYEIDVEASNDRPASVGEDRGTVGLSFRGLAGNGDVLDGRFALTSGVRDNSLSYRVPIGPGGTALELAASDVDDDIIEAPFDQLDIKSHIESWSLTATRPFVQAADRSVSGIVSFEHKRSDSTLLGLPFSFSPGDVDGRARGSSVDLGAEWAHHGESRAYAARAIVRVGVDALDATVHPTGPDSEFVALLAQFQYLHRLSWRDSRVLVRSLVQLTHDPLLAMYKLPIGGRYTVRGYRENQFVRDNGVAVSAEYQFPPLLDDTGRPRSNFYVAVFTDYGMSWDEDARLMTSRKESIASVGAGVLWDPIPALHTELYWGDALDNQNYPNNSLQDKGIHYRVSFQKSF